MILLVDNYDSFTYNLVQLLPENLRILRMMIQNYFQWQRRQKRLFFHQDQGDRRRRETSKC